MGSLSHGTDKLDLFCFAAFSRLILVTLGVVDTDSVILDVKVAEPNAVHFRHVVDEGLGMEVILVIFF